MHTLINNNQNDFTEDHDTVESHIKETEFSILARQSLINI